MIRLICLDVDGTLVGTSGTVHDDVWVAAERTRAAGIHLAICSGRPAFGITREFAERLDPRGWHVFQNGASVIHLATHRSLSARMPAETVAMLVERARRLNRTLELYSDEDYVVERDTEVARTHARLLGIPFRARRYEELQGQIVRGQWLVDAAELDAVAAEPHPGLEFNPSTSPLMPDMRFVNLTPSGVDKASAVRAIAHEYGVPVEQVMFVGDGHNDEAAMRAVGFPVAMANAEPVIRELAVHAVGHVDDAGVIEALDLAVAKLA